MYLPLSPHKVFLKYFHVTQLVETMERYTRAAAVVTVAVRLFLAFKKRKRMLAEKAVQDKIRAEKEAKEAAAAAEVRQLQRFLYHFSRISDAPPPWAS